MIDVVRDIVVTISREIFAEAVEHGIVRVSKYKLCREWGPLPGLYMVLEELRRSESALLESDVCGIATNGKQPCTVLFGYVAWYPL